MCGSAALKRQVTQGRRNLLPEPAPEPAPAERPADGDVLARRAIRRGLALAIPLMSLEILAAR